MLNSILNNMSLSKLGHKTPDETFKSAWLHKRSINSKYLTLSFAKWFLGCILGFATTLGHTFISSDEIGTITPENSGYEILETLHSIYNSPQSWGQKGCLTLTCNGDHPTVDIILVISGSDTNTFSGNTSIKLEYDVNAKNIPQNLACEGSESNDTYSVNLSFTSQDMCITPVDNAEDVYTYQYYAVASVINGIYSIKDHSACGGTYGECFLTTSVNAFSESDTQITVTWVDNLVSETGFIIKDSSGKVIHTTPAGATSYTVSGLACATEYEFSVLAQSGNHVSAPGIVTATTEACSANSNFGSPPPQPNYYQLKVSGSQVHIKSSPSGIDCEYGKGICSTLFDRGEIVKLELVNIKTAEGFSQDDYTIEWFGDADCADQVVTMQDAKSCAVHVYGKPDIDYSAKITDNSTAFETTGQLNILNFSGHGMLRGGAEDIILGFILEGTGSADVTLHADIIDEGVVPTFDLNQVLHDETIGYYGKRLDQQHSMEDFTFDKTIEAGAYTIQLSSNGTKGRGMAGITVKNSSLNLTNLSVRGHLQQPLVFNFIVNGEGSQKAKVSSNILQGNVETKMTLINLATRETISNSAELSSGTTVDITAGAYAVLLETLSGQGIGMIGIDLVQ